MQNTSCRRFLCRRSSLGVAAVITQLANTMIRAIEQDRKVRELDEMEERLAALEARTETASGREAA